MILANRPEGAWASARPAHPDLRLRLQLLIFQFEEVWGPKAPPPSPGGRECFECDDLKSELDREDHRFPTRQFGPILAHAFFRRQHEGSFRLSQARGPLSRLQAIR